MNSIYLTSRKGSLVITYGGNVYSCWCMCRWVFFFRKCFLIPLPKSYLIFWKVSRLTFNRKYSLLYSIYLHKHNLLYGIPACALLPPPQKKLASTTVLDYQGLMLQTRQIRWYQSKKLIALCCNRYPPCYFVAVQSIPQGVEKFSTPRPQR